VAQHGLEISEVGVGAVELYFDEPATATFYLHGVFLRIHSIGPAGSSPEEDRVELLGSISGGA
jgi:hypothetical protein